MSKTCEIKIKKGLNLKLKGEAPLQQLEISLEQGNKYALIPEDFHGVKPKMLVQIGSKVQIGDPVFCNKLFPEMLFVAPISGEIIDIKRGEKRKIISIEIKADSEPSSRTFTPLTDTATPDQIKSRLLESGMWAFIRQRPYDRIASPDLSPRDIFVTANFTAPLAPNFDFLLALGDNKKYFSKALQSLTKLTKGRVFLNVAKPLGLNIPNVEEIVLRGLHPAGLVGTLINKVSPLNQGEVVWTLNATDLFIIGHLLDQNKVDFHRHIVVAGPYAEKKGYLKILPGSVLTEENQNQLAANTEKHLRFIAGDVFTGKKLDDARPFLPMDINQLTIIREGDDVVEPFGWIMPRFNQYSMSRSYFSWLLPGKKYDLDSRLKGGQRAMINSGEFTKVFPLDIMPEQLLKATIAFNIDKMEELGIYEVAPEDFALCEFVDSSKQPLQQIVRQALDNLYKEMN